MSLAVLSVRMSVDSRRPAQPPAFPRLARPGDGKDQRDRPRVEAPPVPEALDEQDPERWDGMA